MWNKTADPWLYLVTERKNLPLEPFFTKVLLAVEGGVNMVQLREKTNQKEEILKLGKELKKRLTPFKVPLIINDHIDIALAIEADGVHLGQGDESVAQARKILGANAIIGLSVQNHKEALAAEKDAISYLSASPLFATLTKTDYIKPWGLDELRALCHASSYPVIAIGGIHASNASDVMKTGVSGIAIVSAIFNAPCPKEAAKTILNAMRSYAR